jgi:hypothetical protein
MNRKGLMIIGLLVSGCATGAVNTPEQARMIALSTVCAQYDPVLVPGEKMPTAWDAERRGDDRWYAWLPYGPGAELLPDARHPIVYGHMGAWINARDGKLLYCELAGAQARSRP